MTAQTAADIRAVMAIIPTPEKWCQGVMARDFAGRPIWPLSRECASRCVLGAVEVVWKRLPRGRAMALLGALSREVGEPIGSWQDSLPGTHAEAHAEVLALMERAAQAEERTP